jgi:hypothetical protein
LSKITDLLAIPIGFLAIKALQGKVKDEEEVKPIVKADPFIKPLDIGPIGFVGPLIGGGGTQNGGPKPTGAGTGLGFGIKYEDIGVPIFPETAATADEVFPSDGISDITKLKDFEYNIPESFDPWWLK